MGASAAADAIAAMDQTTMNGKAITTDVWAKKEPSGEKKESGGKGGGSKGGRWNSTNTWNDSKNTLAKIRQAEDDRKVYVEGIPEGATWKELDKHCADAGHRPGLCEVM